MKKGFVLRFVPLVLIIIFVGLIVMFIFLGKDGHLTKTIAKFPEVFNSVLREVEMRSPAANSLYYFIDIRDAYILSESRTRDSSCFYLLKDGHRRMDEGYILVTEINNNELELTFRTERTKENPSPPTFLNGRPCVVHESLTQEIVTELNKQHWWRRIGDKIIGLVSSAGPLNFKSKPLYVNLLNVSFGREGAYQVWFNEQGVALSHFMLYVDDNICFIPIHRTITKKCEIREGVITYPCLERMKYFKC